MKLLAVLLSCLLAFPGAAATPLDALRSEVRAASEQVGQLRAEQLRRRNELSRVSERIEELKAQTRNRLLPGGELDAALKRSQDLSSELTALAQQVSAGEASLAASTGALVEGLSAEWARLRAQFDSQSDRVVRRGLLADMKRVRSEREALRATLPTALPSLEAPSTASAGDPEDLLERADLLRDQEEKVRRGLQALEGRISERRDELELDRQVQRFLGEEGMFDDQDRRLRVERRREEDVAAATGTTRPNGVSETAAQAPGSMTAGQFGPQPISRTMGAAASDLAPVKELSTPTVHRATDGRPQVGGARPMASDEDHELDELEGQRLKLRSLAEELKAKASELEKKAGSIR